MPTKVTMPQMGYDMTEGTLTRWLKEEGDQVERGEMLAEIETDKVNLEIEAFGSGELRKIFTQEGATVPVGGLLAVIAKPDEEVDLEALSKEERKEPTPPAAGTRAKEGEPARREDGRVRASPVARKKAQEAGIDLAEIEGSGPGGRIQLEDVEKAVAGREKETPPKKEPPKEPKEERAPAPEVRPVELSKMRQTIARRMTQSKQQAPHFYVTMRLDMTEAVRLRERLNEVAESDEDKLSINDMILKAVAMALQKHPQLNATLTEDGIQQHEQINLGVAVALEEGLIAPAVTDVAGKSLQEIVRASKDLLRRTRDGKLRPEEYGQGTFTVSNMGMFGVDEFVAIINPPQAGILAVGAVKKAPVVYEGQVAVRQVMALTLSADHRVVDGAYGARFLGEVKRILENPVTLLL